MVEIQMHCMCFCTRADLFRDNKPTHTGIGFTTDLDPLFTVGSLFWGIFEELFFCLVNVHCLFLYRCIIKSNESPLLLIKQIMLNSVT